MKYRNLGRTGVKVSRLCLGTASFGRDTDIGEASNIFHASLDAGINFVDTANVYGRGAVEELLGKCMQGQRDKIVLASKAFSPMSDDLNDAGASRRHLTRSVDASLRRLGTDRLDLFYLHGFDYETPLEETLDTIDGFVRSGKILYFGVSNWSAWQIATALGVAQRERLPEIRCIQPLYNLVKRQAEMEILPLASYANLAVAPYNVLAGGLLSGKYSGAAPETSGRLMDDRITNARYQGEGNFATANGLAELSATTGHKPADLAVAWVLNNQTVTAPIIGVRSMRQLQQWLDALSVNLSCELQQAISSLSNEPPFATGRSEERLGVVPA